jgi:uncharacterized caspase-like protein
MKMKLWSWILAGSTILALCIHSASAEERLALVIGNQDYKPLVGAKLKNPYNDIKLVGEALQQIGFETVFAKDQSRAQILGLVDKFATELSRRGPGAIGFFYYAGHGAAHAETRINYLIPVNVVQMQDMSSWYEAVSLDELLEILRTRAPHAALFVVFDACRNELHLPGRTVGSRGFEPQLGKAGVYVAFSTSPNMTASDQGDDNGPYARALASELRVVGQDHHHLFSRVRQRVFSAIGQHPWANDGLIGDYFLAGTSSGEITPRPVGRADYGQPDPKAPQPGAAYKPRSGPGPPWTDGLYPGWGEWHDQYRWRRFMD